MIPFTAKTIAKNATSQAKTTRPVNSRGVLAFDIQTLRRGTEEMVTHLRDLAAMHVDEAEQN
jgi:hypothetical protein